MGKKFIELESGLMMEVDLPQSEIEMISGGSDVVEKVDKSIVAVKELLIKSIEPITEAYKTNLGGLILHPYSR